VGDAAAGRDLPLPGRQDGGDPRALPPGPTGNYTTNHSGNLQRINVCDHQREDQG
jgi:hypothetical protein